MIITVIICAAVYKGFQPKQQQGMISSGTGGGKVVWLVFNVCIAGGAVLGLLEVLVAALMFIGLGGFSGYVLFFRHSNP